MSSGKSKKMTLGVFTNTWNKLEKVDQDPSNFKSNFIAKEYDFSQINK